MLSRFFALASFSLFIAACSSTGSSTTDAATLADAFVLDTGASVDASRIEDAAASDTITAVDASDVDACSCRSGRYHATGTGSGFAIDYDFDLAECGGEPLCHVGHAPAALAETPCMMTADGVFRVYLDMGGFAQLVFRTSPCDAPWTGVYATEGGSVTVTATRS
jgi:hypothetical protein